MAYDDPGKGVSYPELVELLVDQSWVEVLQNELCKPYMEKLAQFVRQEAAAKIPIYPPAAKLFNAFNSCPFESVKVVILGQVRKSSTIFSINQISGSSQRFFFVHVLLR
jgi:hypothetical protein